MDRDPDDDPDTDETPPRRSPYDSASRRSRMTSPAGVTVPALVLDRPSRAMLQAALDEEAAAAPLTRDEIVSVVADELEKETKRRFRRLWGVLGAVAGSAFVALAAAAKSLLADARAAGADQLRIQIIERDLERARAKLEALESALFRPSRRDEQPDPPATSSASKRILP